MIPLPNAIDNHQLFNAEHIMDINMGIIHQEKNGVENLKNLLNKINEEKLYEEWQKQVDQKHFNASNQIANAIIENL